MQTKNKFSKNKIHKNTMRSLLELCENKAFRGSLVTFPVIFFTNYGLLAIVILRIILLLSLYYYKVRSCRVRNLVSFHSRPDQKFGL